jgi:serine phosphatase RsbU (regulator of sigma subunit)
MTDVGVALGELVGRGVGEATRGEERIALASCAALYFVGGSLTFTSPLLPHVSSPNGVLAIALTAYATAAGLLLALRSDRGGLLLAWVADLWGVVLITLLCAATGAATSPFALIYFFALGHAAAFQPRGRFLVVALAATLGFLAPLAYSHVSANFGAIVVLGAVLALMTTWLVHYALERIRDQRWRLEFLIAATAKLDTSLDPRQTLRRIAGTALPTLADVCVVDLVDGDGSITTTVAAAVDPVQAQEIEAMRRDAPPDTHGSNPLARALLTRRPSVVDSAAEPEWLAASVAAPSDGRERAAAVFPMVARGRVLGAICFVRDGSFAAAQLALLEELTGRASLAFDNARLYAERAHVAHTLRRSLMPSALPQVRGLELASYYRPMGAGNEVGGDFYDVFGERDSCWLVVGDVCGKGAEAAVLTGFLRHTTLAYAREERAPADVLRRVNRAMLDQEFDGRFATAILAHLKISGEEAEVAIASAGHPAALIVRAGGETEELSGAGTLLGVFANPTIVDTRARLHAGDALALYTDGLTEAHAPQRFVTTGELAERLRQAGPHSATGTIDALIGLVDMHNAARDDIAVLAARVKDRAAAELA